MSAESKHAAGVNAELFRALGQPLRGRILVILDERQASPTEIAERLDESLDNVSYHVRELAKLNLIELVDTDTRRGGTQHFYKATARPILDAAAWEQIPQLVRELNSVYVAGVLLGDVKEAIDARTFDARAGRSMVRMRVVLDEQGWDGLEELGQRYFDDLQELQAESAARLAKTGSQGTAVMTGLLAFEVPVRDED